MTAVDSSLADGGKTGGVSRVMHWANEWSTFVLSGLIVWLVLPCWGDGRQSIALHCKWHLLFLFLPFWSYQNSSQLRFPLMHYHRLMVCLSEIAARSDQQALLSGGVNRSRNLSTIVCRCRSLAVVLRLRCDHWCFPMFQIFRYLGLQQYSQAHIALMT